MDQYIYIELAPLITENIIYLPEVYEREVVENWHIAIQSFSLNFTPRNVGIAKIYLEELDGYHGGLVQDKILTLFNLDSTQVQKERKTLEFIKLNTHTISKLTFKILDDLNRPIILSKKSHLTLKIKRMDKQYESFSVHSEIEGRNKISKFSHKLPHPLHLDHSGNWKIALTSIIFPNPKLGRNDELTIRISNPLSGPGGNNIPEVVQMNNGEMVSIQHFLTTMKKKIRETLELEKNTRFHISVDSSNKVTIISGLNLQLSFSNRLAYLMGFVHDGFMKAGRKIQLKKNVRYECPYHMDLNRDITEIMKVKCAQTVPTIFNDYYDHILKIIPIRTSDDKYFYYENEELEFHHILPSTLSSIDITLEDQDGLPIPYKSSRFDKVYVSFKIIHDKI